jgi:hypothetical protein
VQHAIDISEGGVRHAKVLLYWSDAGLEAAAGAAPRALGEVPSESAGASVNGVCALAPEESGAACASDAPGAV